MSEVASRRSCALVELADFKKMNQIRARVDAIVKDKRTAEALKPWYRQFCKRPTFNDEYLPAFNRPNVTLVDTMGRGVDRITEKGLVFDGIEYEVDCIIFATGFEVGTAYTRRAGFEVYGRGGKSLDRELGRRYENAARFLQRRFPELLPHGHHAKCINRELSAHARRAGATHHRAYSAREIARGAMHRTYAEAEAEWVATIKEKALNNQGLPEECTPGYYNNEGKPEKGLGLAGDYTAAARSSSTTSSANGAKTAR